MGMFDTIVHNRTDICCPNGHVLKDLQTKDFDLCLYEYRLDDEGVLHGPSLNHEAFPRTNVLVGDQEVVGCAFCETCFPLSGPDKKTVTYANGQTNTEYGPLYDFTLTFVDGKLFSVVRSEE